MTQLPPARLTYARTSALAFATLTLLGGLGGLACKGRAPDAGRNFSAIQSGDRLRAVWYRADGGVGVFVGWFDLDLQTPCQFHALEGAGWRCVPRYADAGFADAACTERVVFVPEGCLEQAPEIARVGSAPEYACGDSYASVTGDFFALGAVVDAAPSTMYWRDESGDCVELNGLGPGALRALGSVLDPETFASAERETEFPGGRVGLDMLRSPDGAQQILGVVDLELETPCWPSLGILNSVCAPSSGAFVRHDLSYHADASCSGQELAYSWIDDGCDPFMIERYVQSVCGFSTTYAALGAEVSGPFYEYEPNADMCIEVTSTQRFFEVGPDVPLSSLIQVEPLESGTGRLRGSLPSADGEVELVVPHEGALRLRDTEFDAECTLTRLPDGSTRCVPQQITTSSLYYASDTCTGTRVAWSEPPNECSPIWEWLVYMDPDATTSCLPPISGVYRRVSIYDGPIYQRDEATDTCAEVMIDPGATEIYVTLEEVPLTSFAAFTLETD